MVNACPGRRTRPRLRPVRPRGARTAHTASARIAGAPARGMAAWRSGSGPRLGSRRLALPWSAPIDSAVTIGVMPEFSHVDVLPLGPDDTEYRQLDLGGV